MRPFSTTPSTHRPDPTELHREPAVAGYAPIPHDRPRTSCIRDTIDVGLLITLPCEPMARASSSVGINYASVFLLIALVYGGSIACFGASAMDHHPLFRLSTGGAVLAGWVLDMMGPIASGTLIFFGWNLVAILPYVDEDPATTFDASATSKVLVVTHIVCQVSLLVIVAFLRHEILTRSHASSCCSPGPGSFCFTLCFPYCSFAEAMQRARAARDEQASRNGQDELPAYVA